MQDRHDSQTKPRPSAFVRLRRRLLSWGAVRAVLIAFAVIVAVLAIVWVEENWRGKQAWEKYKREWEVKGERYDLASFMPEPVPPEQNFAATPFLAPLMHYEVVRGAAQWRDSNAVARLTSVSARGASPFIGNWRAAEFTDLDSAQERLRADTNFPSRTQEQTPAEDVLFALGKYDPVLEELRQASTRPYAAFSDRLEASPFVAAQQFSAIKSITQILILRAAANLEAGRTADALADVELALHLAKPLQSKPLLIVQMVRIAVLRVSLQPVWEGLAKRRWTEPDLRRIQEHLAAIDLFEDYGVSMRGERAFSCELMAQTIAGQLPGEPATSTRFTRSFMPRGLLYQNQIAICRLFQEIILPAVDAKEHRVYPKKTRDDALEAVVGARTPYNMFAQLLFPAIQRSSQQCASAQASVDMALVACALERYRLANGRYPDALQSLAPRFIEKVPNDSINGQALNYRRFDDGAFSLYSVGWNGDDDGGEVVMRRGGGIDDRAGDWVWQY